MSGLLGSWATENHSRLLKQLNTRQKNLTTSSSWKQENISLGVEKQWPSPLILTDMDEYECVPLCESIWHMHTICAVFCALCSGTCDGLRVRGWCLCLLVCNSSQSVVREASAIYRNNSSLCRILCLRRLWSRFFFFFLLTLAPLWDFLLGATFCWLGKPRSLSLEVNIQHDWLGFLKTHRQDGIYCYDMTCSGIRYIGGIQPLIFTNNAVQCSWVILCPNSQRLYRAARQFQYERKFCGLADQS